MKLFIKIQPNGFLGNRAYAFLLTEITVREIRCAVPFGGAAAVSFAKQSGPFSFFMLTP
jgi:hypothetical protein